tara:strand:+ start:135 stop:377 length:243 start_codon:yes stop_codon:yes gene_type:complete
VISVRSLPRSLSSDARTDCDVEDVEDVVTHRARELGRRATRDAPARDDDEEEEEEEEEEEDANDRTIALACMMRASLTFE